MPAAILWPRLRRASVARKAPGRLNRRLEESSRGLSNHWLAAGKAGVRLEQMTYLDRPATLSESMGFRFWGMAEEPTCSVSNGSSISLRFWSNLMSLVILWADWAIPERQARSEERRVGKECRSRW